MRRISVGMALSVGLAAGGAMVGASIPGPAGAAMTENACQRLSLEELLLAVDQGRCTLDVLPAAGAPPLLAEGGGTEGGQNTDGDASQDGASDGSGGSGDGGGSSDGSSGSDGGSAGSDGGAGSEDGGTGTGDDGRDRGNNGFGNGGQDGSPNGHSDSNR